MPTTQWTKESILLDAKERNVRYVRLMFTDITGTITLPEGVDMVKPGDNTKVIGELIHPIAMDKGLKLAIREGGRTIASGQVTEILA